MPLGPSRARRARPGRGPAPLAFGSGPETRVELTALAHGGDAVGHVEVRGERRAVFVRGGTPGDVVRARIDPSRRPARGVILEVLAPGRERVRPPCPWASRCGGCDWMHVSHEGQLAAHAAHVREAVGAGPEIEVFAAARTERYREHARLHAACGTRAVVGPHEIASHGPLGVDACLVLHPVLDEARVRVAALLECARGTGEVGLALGALREPRRAVLELRFSGELPPAFFGRLERAIGDGLLAGARVWIEGARAPAVSGDPTPWTTGPDGEPLELAPGGFAQAHPEVNRALGRWVGERVHGARVVELYAGAGNITVLLARQRGASVTAVEADPASCDAARRNLARRGLGARVVCAEADAGALPGDLDCVVLDPPRGGARAFCEGLAERRASRAPRLRRGARRIVYVSCDPPSLRRDLALLSPRWTVRHAALFEMFPQTSHVETAVVAERRRT